MPDRGRAGGRHGRDEYRTIAETGTVLRCQVGSGVHGIAIGGYDDRDEMGICIEPPEYVIGLRRFEQYIYRSQPEGVRSGAGDLDLVVYSLRKWMRLALAGNPSVLLPLFVPDSEVVTITQLGRQLRARRDMILSREAGHRFAGYLEAQRRSLLSRDGKGRDVTRPELVAAYGFDTKYCAHMVRLGLQGVELLETGRITLPVPEPHRTWLRELRQGGHTMQDALDRAAELEARLRELTATSPSRADRQPRCPDRVRPADVRGLVPDGAGGQRGAAADGEAHGGHAPRARRSTAAPLAQEPLPHLQPGGQPATLPRRR